jgi:hypothetical protein
MSMIMSLLTVRDETIDRLLSEPPLIWRLLATDNPDFYFLEIGAPTITQPTGVFAPFAGKRRDTQSEKAPELPNLMLTADENIGTDLDKAWHGIHFLLTKSQWEGEEPLCFIVRGGEPIGEVDVGYGPARAIRSDKVRQWSRTLEQISTEEFRSRFDPKLMMAESIYPQIWDRDPSEDDTIGYLTEYFKSLKDFLKAAASKGMGLIVTCQ